MGTTEVATQSTHLAVERKLAASTQNQAFAAILFLYQQEGARADLAAGRSEKWPQADRELGW